MDGTIARLQTRAPSGAGAGAGVAAADPVTDDPTGVVLGRPTRGRRDALALARLHLASWHATYGPLLPSGARRAFRLTEREAAMRAALDDPARRACSWIAQDAHGSSDRRSGPAREQSTDGFVLARPLPAEPATDLPLTGEIEALHVAPGSQGRGIGRLLLAAALADLRAAGCTRATLWVLEDNVAARAFYEHLGWRREGSPTRRPMGAHPGLPVVVELRYALELEPPATSGGPADGPSVTSLR